jgi:hypothetical protein
MFNISALGFIMDAVLPKKAISAKYPLAPPCPTEAYKKAMMGNNK